MGVYHADGCGLLRVKSHETEYKHRLLSLALRAYCFSNLLQIMLIPKIFQVISHEHVRMIYAALPQVIARTATEYMVLMFARARRSGKWSYFSAFVLIDSIRQEWSASLLTIEQ